MGYPSLNMKSFTIAAALLVIAEAGPIVEESIRSPAQHAPIGFEDTVLPLSRASVFIDRTTDTPSTSSLKADLRMSFLLDKFQELSTPDIVIPEVAAVSDNGTQKTNVTESYVTIADMEPHNVSAIEYVSLLENVKVGEAVSKLEEADTSTANLDEVSTTTEATVNTTSKDEPDEIALPVILIKPHETDTDTPRIVLTLRELHDAEKLAAAKLRQEKAEVKPNYQILKITDGFNESKPRGTVQEIPLRDGIKFEVPSIINNYFYNVFMSLLGANPYGRLQPILSTQPVIATRVSRSIPVLLDLKSALAVNCTEHMKN